MPKWQVHHKYTILGLLKKYSINSYQGNTIKSFEKLNLHPDILKAVAHAKYEQTTAIQNKVVPLALKGVDVLGASKSGTGKTAAYVLPLLNKLHQTYQKYICVHPHLL